jgi:hypothetical protein
MPCRHYRRAFRNTQGPAGSIGRSPDVDNAVCQTPRGVSVSRETVWIAPSCEILGELDLNTDREGNERTSCSLRHTYISMRLMEGTNVYQVARHCQHRSENITPPSSNTGWTAINLRKRRNGQIRLPLISFGDAARFRYKRIGVRAWRNGRRTGLKSLSAQQEIAGVELPKFGETFAGNPEPSPKSGRCRD